MPEAAAFKDAVEVPFEELEGAHIRLKRIEANEAFAKELARDQQLRYTIGILERTPNLQELSVMMGDQELVVWSIKRAIDQQHRGYACFVCYDGPPYIALHLKETDEAAAWGPELVELLLPVFFGNTNESALFIYPPKPVPESIHAALMEGGFDLWEDNPTMNSALVSCYFIERHTFDAYYGEDNDEFEKYEDEGYGY